MESAAKPGPPATSSIRDTHRLSFKCSRLMLHGQLTTAIRATAKCFSASMPWLAQHHCRRHAGPSPRVRIRRARRAGCAPAMQTIEFFGAAINTSYTYIMLRDVCFNFVLHTLRRVCLTACICLGLRDVCLVRSDVRAGNALHKTGCCSAVNVAQGKPSTPFS